MKFSCGEQDGKQFVQVQLAEVCDPRPLMAALHQAFPQLWAEESLKIVMPPKVNGVNRILNAE